MTMQNTTLSKLFVDLIKDNNFKKSIKYCLQWRLQEYLDKEMYEVIYDDDKIIQKELKKIVMELFKDAKYKKEMKENILKKIHKIDLLTQK